MHDLSDDSNEQGSSTEEENQTGDDTELKERYVLFLQYLNEQIKFYILESQISQNNLSNLILHRISQKIEFYFVQYLSLNKSELPAVFVGGPCLC